MTRTPTIGVAAAFAAPFLLLGGCRPIEEAIEERFRDLTPYEEYAGSLEEAGLAGSALGRDWLGAGRAALTAPASVTTPYREEGYLAPEEPAALGYRFAARRGQRIRIEVTWHDDPPGRLFLDLFRTRRDTADAALPVAHSGAEGDGGDAGGRRIVLEHEPRWDAEHVLRIQPELLRGGAYEVRIVSQPTLAFPVDGRDEGAIRSGFGAARDGGRREHHGVDIFAPRGTPALAAVDGRVRGVRETPLGGRVVWIRDERRGQSLYYAHLDSQLVRSGDRVRPGDTLGLVGNTGNARSTPPHLHFGIYVRGEGPVDPQPFLHRPPVEPAPLTADSATVGEWVRGRTEGLRLRAGPSEESPALDSLARHTAMRVMARSGGWYRVRLPDGREGFVAGGLAEGAGEPVRGSVAEAAVTVRSAPRPGAPRIAVLEPGARLAMLGSFRDAWLVQAPDGRLGWVDAP